VVIEQVVMPDRMDFCQAVTVLFASFFIFNMQYPVGAERTLEFMQRSVILLATVDVPVKAVYNLKTSCSYILSLFT